MEVRRVEGNELVQNCVYNIYKEDGNNNVGVCLVIGENNRNNRNKIKLRKLIGNDELSLNKSEIYGKKPVDLTGADLTGANLCGANLRGANLTDAILPSAILTGANLLRAKLHSVILTGANLNGAILTLAHLTGANLTGANLHDAILNATKLNGATLIRANLIGANLNSAKLHSANLTSATLNGATLIGANLTSATLNGATLIGADLTGATLNGATLIGADLTGATIFRDSLSDEQQQSQIIGQPSYIQIIPQIPIQAQEYFNISKELSNGNRISIKNGKILNNSNFKTQHRISFTRLLDFLLQEENQAKIEGKIRIGGEKGEEGIDYGGITLIIFQKCYEAFMERYFYPYEEEDNSNYVVLKDLTDEQFEEFKKACAFMILLAKKVENQLGQPFQILIPINFLLFQVLIFEGNQETFFELGNKNKFFCKRENGSYSNQHKLNNPYNYIAINSINNNKNNFSIQRMYKGKYNNNQNNQNNQKSKNFNAFSEVEQQKLMFLMLLKQNHIHKRSHYEIMKKFIDEIFKPNKDMFTTSIDYSYKAFVKRLKFKLSSESHNRNLKSFKILEIASNPLIKLLLDYIKVSDEYRMVMTAYVCGSYCYTGDIKILIFTNSSIFPFQSRTCIKELHLFIIPKNIKLFNWLKNEPTNSDYSIKGLYNVFLDRTTQIA